MTVADLIAAIAGLPPDTQVVLDLGLDGGFLQAAVSVDDLGDGKSGVRIILDEDDDESCEVAGAIKLAFN